jgi:acetyltransferase
MIVELPWIAESDINPMIASEDQLLALDARVVLHDVDTAETKLPKPAIRPYPVKYISKCEIEDGTRITLRPISPEDEGKIADFHETLSEESVYLRYANKLNLKQRTAHDRLTRICFVDYDREMVLVATIKDPNSGKKTIVGVGRLSKIHGTGDANFSILITDAFQHKGLGTAILEHLLEIGRNEQFERVRATILKENKGAQKLCENLGFKIEPGEDEQFVQAVIKL